MLFRSRQLRADSRRSHLRGMDSFHPRRAEVPDRRGVENRHTLVGMVDSHTQAADRRMQEEADSSRMSADSRRRVQGSHDVGTGAANNRLSQPAFH